MAAEGGQLRIIANRDFRLLVAAGTVSQLGDWAAKIALSLLVYQRTGSASAVGLVNAVMVLPWLGFGQWVASRCDRFDRRRLLFSCDAGRGAIFIAIGLGDLPMAPLLGLVALTATIDSVFEVNRAALLADLVSHDDYADAIRVNHVLDQAAQLIGYGSGGLMAGALGAGNALVVNGVTFGVSALLVAAISRARTSERASVKPSLSKAGAYLLSDRVSLVAVAVTVVVLFCLASVEYQAVIYGQVAVGLTSSQAGLLAAAVPTGSLLALAVLRTSGDDLGLLRRGCTIGTVAGVAAATLLALGRPFGAFAGFALVGVVLTVSTFANVVVGRRIPAEIRGSTFAVLQAVIFAAGSAGMAAGGLASDLSSPTVAASAALALATAACGATLLRSRGMADARRPAVIEPVSAAG